MIKFGKTLALLCASALALLSVSGAAADLAGPDTETQKTETYSTSYTVTIPLIIEEETNEKGILTATDGQGFEVSLDLKESGLRPGHYEVALDWVEATEEQILKIEEELSEDLGNGIRKVAHLPRDRAVMLLDISIVDTETGKNAEPSGKVKVTIRKDGLDLPTIVHFIDKTHTETIAPEGDTFETKDF